MDEKDSLCHVVQYRVTRSSDYLDYRPVISARKCIVVYLAIDESFQLSFFSTLLLTHFTTDRRKFYKMNSSVYLIKRIPKKIIQKINKGRDRQVTGHAVTLAMRRIEDVLN